MSTKISEFRPVKTYFPYIDISPYIIVNSETSRTIDDELWCLLEYYSDIRETGLKLFDKYNKREAEKYYKHFQAFIRQAKSYYNSAKALMPRSSSLLYYYSFLNLAKAAVVKNDPSVCGHIYHGLVSQSKTAKNFEKEKVKIKDGVFPKLYKLYFNTNINTTTLNINTLLSYCTDIGIQYFKAGNEKQRILPCFHSIVLNESQYWSIIGVGTDVSFGKYRKSLGTFFKAYDVTKLPSNLCNEIFKKTLHDFRFFTFFQDKETIPLALNNTFKQDEIRLLSR